MNLDQIKELMASLESSGLKKISVKKGDFELQLEKEGEPASPMMAHLPPHYHPPFLGHTPQPAPVEQVQLLESSKPKEVAGKFITSPMVGTFYTSPAPDQPPFVKIGDRVEEQTVVCIIEAMKVMNEVKAGMSGIVAEIIVDHAEPVEFGSKIFRIVSGS